MAAGKMLLVRQVSKFNNFLNWDAFPKQYSRNSQVKAALKVMGFPAKPKRPNLFAIYNSENRSSIKQQHPEKSFGEITKILADQWKKMSESEKKKYTLEYEKKKKQYEVELETYKKNYGLTQESDMQEIVDAYNAEKKQKVYEKLLKEETVNYNKPKRPTSPFMLYIQETTKKENLNLKTIAEMWNNLPESEKENYRRNFNKLKENYQKVLKKWEEEMLQEGKFELVRISTIMNKLNDYS